MSLRETGIDNDYFNEFYLMYSFWDEFPSEHWLKCLQEHPPRKYFERFSYKPSDDNVNMESVRRLDEICDEMKVLSNPEKYSDGQLIQLLCEAHDLIYGRSGWLSSKIQAVNI